MQDAAFIYDPNRVLIRSGFSAPLHEPHLYPYSNPQPFTTATRTAMVGRDTLGAPRFAQGTVPWNERSTAANPPEERSWTQSVSDWWTEVIRGAGEYGETVGGDPYNGRDYPRDGQDIPGRPPGARPPPSGTPPGSEIAGVGSQTLMLAAGVGLVLYLLTRG